jgi:hypothetical protein
MERTLNNRDLVKMELELRDNETSCVYWLLHGFPRDAVGVIVGRDDDGQPGEPLHYFGEGSAKRNCHEITEHIQALMEWYDMVTDGGLTYEKLQL